MLKIKWDQVVAQSRGNENRASTDYVRGTIFGVLDPEFENLVGKRAITWCEGDIDPEQYLGKIQEIMCDLRDEVQVIGSTQTSLVLSNVEILRPIEGDEAAQARKEIMRAQNTNLQARGVRGVVRNAQTGQVSATQEAGAILEKALNDPSAALKAAHALTAEGTGLTPEQAAPVAGALLMASAGALATPAAPTGVPGNPFSNTLGTAQQAGDSIVGGVEHEQQSPYRRQEGVSHEAVPVQPTMGTVGGATAHVEGEEHLSPNPNAKPGEQLPI